MGSVGNTNFKYTMNSLDNTKANSFVRFFNNILRENGIPIFQATTSRDRKVKDMASTKVTQNGVAVSRDTSSASPYNKSDNSVNEDIFIYTRGFISKEDAQKIADTILASDSYKRQKQYKVKDTRVHIS